MITDFGCRLEAYRAVDSHYTPCGLWPAARWMFHFTAPRGGAADPDFEQRHFRSESAQLTICPKAIFRELNAAGFDVLTLMRDALTGER